MAVMAELILFGIKAGVKLTQQSRRVYVETTIDRDVTLPLPNFNPEHSAGSADGYFHGAGRIYLNENPVLKELYAISIKQTRELTDEEKQRYVAFYIDYKRFDDIRAGKVKGDNIGLSKEALLSVVSVRQWANRKSPYPSPFQRVAGTLIEIGIDYFTDIPGALDERSATGRALKGFLKSIDDVDFAAEKIDMLARDLFIAAIEAVGENPDLLNADKKTEKLVEAVASGLVNDARKRIAMLGGQDLELAESVQEWAQLVLRSVLSNAGEIIYASPGFYLGIDDPAHQALAGSIGKSVFDVILDTEHPDLSGLISREGLDTIIKTSLKTVSENPGLLGVEQNGLKGILSQIALELADSSKILSPAVIPEVIRLILEKTAVNIELVWPEKFRNDPAKHLLITASKELLNQLSKQPQAGAWQPKLSKEQVIELLEIVLDEVIQNPDWLINVAEKENSILETAINAALSAIQNSSTGRISPQAVQNILEATICAVAVRRNLLDEIAFFGKQTKAIVAVLELIFGMVISAAAEPDVRWFLGRTEVFNKIVSTVLSRISETGVSEDILLKLKKALDETAQDIVAGKQISLESLITNINNLGVA